MFEVHNSCNMSTEFKKKKTCSNYSVIMCYTYKSMFSFQLRNMFFILSFTHETPAANYLNVYFF